MATNCAATYFLSYPGLRWVWMRSFFAYFLSAVSLRLLSNRASIAAHSVQRAKSGRWKVWAASNRFWLAGLWPIEIVVETQSWHNCRHYYTLVTQLYLLSSVSMSLCSVWHKKLIFEEQHNGTQATHKIYNRKLDSSNWTQTGETSLDWYEMTTLAWFQPSDAGHDTLNVSRIRYSKTTHSRIQGLGRHHSLG